MELSESVQRGLQSLADQSSVDHSGFQVLVDVSSRSLFSSPADPAVLDQAELKHVDRILLKQMHTAATTFILEAVKQNADRSTISSSLEELTFSAERIEIFLNTFQKYKKDLEHLLTSIGRHPAQVNDVSWRLQYHMKSGQLDKVNEPFYLISLNTENEGSSEDINFTCTTEQLQKHGFHRYNSLDRTLSLENLQLWSEGKLQDLVGKLKDAAKSVEKASQM